jgi:hypothetical protein
MSDYSEVRHKKHNPVTDKTGVWDALAKLADAPEQVLAFVSTFAESKRITLDSLIANDVRYKVSNGGGVILAYAVWTEAKGEEIVCGIKYRPLDPEQKKFCEPGSALVEPLSFPRIIPDGFTAQRLYLTEGETDAIRISLLDPEAIVMCAPHGVGQPSDWKSEWLEGVNPDLPIYVAFDSDGAGETTAKAIIQTQNGHTVIRLTPPDVKDWCEWDGGAEELKRLRENVALNHARSNYTAADLAAVLDRGDLMDTAGEPHEVLTKLADFVQLYVVLTRQQAETVALWVMNTHLYAEWDVTPYLGVLASTMRAGKTRLLEVIEPIVRSGWVCVTPSAAVVFRKVDADRPTMLVDEVDAVFKQSEQEALRGILNSGFQRSGTVPRITGANNDQLTEFSTYCPKAFAGIGLDILPGTIRDRTIPIELKRKTRTEQVRRFRRKQFMEDVQSIQADVLLTAATLHGKVRFAEPELPQELDDRAQDIWEPLLAIADAVGHGWPERAREAAILISGNRDARDEATASIMLLRDIRSIFNKQGADRLPTATIRALLAEDEEAPWATWHSKAVDRVISARAIANLLKGFDISSTTIRLPESSTPKGYHRASFEDAWRRYLPETPAVSATPPQQPANPAVEPDSGVAASSDEENPENTPATPETRRSTGTLAPCGGVAANQPVEDAYVDDGGCLICGGPLSGSSGLRCSECSS